MKKKKYIILIFLLLNLVQTKNDVLKKNNFYKVPISLVNKSFVNRGTKTNMFYEHLFIAKDKRSCNWVTFDHIYFCYPKCHAKFASNLIIKAN